jgi:hypothetical protein
MVSTLVRAAHAGPAPFWLRDREVIAMSENRLSMDDTEDEVTATANGNGDRAALHGKNCVPKGEPSPIGNGSNGGPATPTPHIGAAQGPDGRFAKGNPGGPGNPFARQVAALRQAALAAITPEDVRAILAKMAELALGGDVQAAKLVLAYAIGKPAPPADPDRLDVQEWQHFKETAPMVNEAENLLTPEPRVLLPGIRWGRQAKTWEFADGLSAVLQAPGPASPPLRGRADRSPKVGHASDDARRGPPRS